MVTVSAVPVRCGTDTATVVAEKRYQLVVVVVVATMGLVVETVVDTVVEYSRRLWLQRFVVAETVVLVDPDTDWKMHSLLGVVAIAGAARMFETSV